MSFTTKPARHPKTIMLLVAASATCLLFACDKHREEQQPAVALEPVPPPPVPSPAPEAPLVSASAPAAVPARIGVFQGPPDGVVVDGWAAGGLCNIERIGAPVDNKPVVLKSGAHVSVSGWALDPGGTMAPQAIHVRFVSRKAGDFFGTAARRTLRDDVNSTHPLQDKAAQSGFELDFDADQLPVGDYSVTTVMVFAEKSYICDNGRKVLRTP